MNTSSPLTNVHWALLDTLYGAREGLSTDLLERAVAAKPATARQPCKSEIHDLLNNQVRGESTFAEWVMDPTSPDERLKPLSIRMTSGCRAAFADLCRSYSRPVPDFKPQAAQKAEHSVA